MVPWVVLVLAALVVSVTNQHHTKKVFNLAHLFLVSKCTVHILCQKEMGTYITYITILIFFFLYFSVFLSVDVGYLIETPRGY